MIWNYRQLAVVVTALVAVVLWTTPSRGDRTGMVQVYGGPDGGMSAGAAALGERTYFVLTAATDEEATAMHRRLVTSGARDVNLFYPDNVIVCRLPETADVEALSAAPGVRMMRESQVGPTTVSATGRSIEWIREAHEGADRMIHGAAPSTGHANAAAPFDDVLFTISPERARKIQDEIALRGPSLVSGPDGVEREVFQNSEFLGGSILAMFVYPESNGSADPKSESWTDLDLVSAERGTTMGMLAWQGRWPGMRMNFIFENYERSETVYEPIQHNMNSDATWILDTVRRIFPAELGRMLDAEAAVHAMNNLRRAARGTDWVFTSFIARSYSSPDHRFSGANYTAYAYLGGPYMVEPFPAGLDPNNIGEELVFSQVAQHEIGHLFWTLDEYPGAPGGCADKSGYLNYENGNINVLGPGGTIERCNFEVDCIMNQAAREDLGRPFCDWSEGHLGVADANNNGIADIFEARPEIIFEIEGPETVITNHVSLRLKARSKAVPNRNSRIPAAVRVNYAAPLRDGYYSLGGSQTRVSLYAIDGRFDEVEEDCRVELDVATVGRTTLTFVARNEAGYESFPYKKDIYFIGIHYTHLGVAVRPGVINVFWEVIGEDFDAAYNLYRLDPGETLPGTLVAENVLPSGPGNTGFVPYRFTDPNVEPGVEYRYYVEGVFTLNVAGQNRDFRAASNTVSNIAMLEIPAGSLISNASPNPFREAVQISMTVPRTFVEGTIGGHGVTQRVATPVEVTVYDVQGRRIKQLQRSNEFSEVLTVRWDGTTLTNAPAPTGIYFVRARIGDQTALQKVVLIR